MPDTSHREHLYRPATPSCGPTTISWLRTTTRQYDDDDDDDDDDKQQSQSSYFNVLYTMHRVTSARIIIDTVVIVVETEVIKENYVKKKNYIN